MKKILPKNILDLKESLEDIFTEPVKLRLPLFSKLVLIPGHIEKFARDINFFSIPYLPLFGVFTYFCFMFILFNTSNWKPIILFYLVGVISLLIICIINSKEEVIENE